MAASPWMHFYMIVLAFLCMCTDGAEIEPKMSNERAVFETQYGNIEFGFLPEVAPKTAAHIFHLITMGCYTSNHIFRVDRGFVAQTADVVSGRTLPLPDRVKEIAAATVPLEVVAGVKHHAGVLSMGRYDDPNSGTSSFSMLLGDAPHLDMQYTIFAKVTQGMDVLHKLEELPTKTEGIFVMPLERITILNTYWYDMLHPAALRPLGASGSARQLDSEEELEALRERFKEQDKELQRVRKKCLPV